MQHSTHSNTEPEAESFHSICSFIGNQQMVLPQGPLQVLHNEIYRWLGHAEMLIITFMPGCALHL